MTIDDLKQQSLIIFECFSGSRAYGTNTPKSDTDIRGVFVLPEDDFFGFSEIDQVSDATNDIVYYELGKFVRLLLRNNPNIMELLFTPEDCVLHRDPLMDLFDGLPILSKLCKETYGGYAYAQINKAKGLNKKVNNPEEPVRKLVLDFCFVLEGQGTVPVSEFLKSKGWKQEGCGVSKIPKTRGMYALFHQENGNFRGIYRKEESNDICLSSIPKGIEPVAHMSFNVDEYSVYCKKYRQYWEWVEKRNEERYLTNQQHEKGYDSKNMMHVFRLLETALEIAEGKGLVVRRPNQEELLRIRAGEFAYDDLLGHAEEMMAQVDRAFEASHLPEQPNREDFEKVLIEIRQAFYDRGA